MKKRQGVKKNSSCLAWIIWALAASFYFYEFLLQVSPNVMVPELMKTFQLDAAQLGNLAACYFYIYAAMQIPSGFLLDRYGPRYLLTFGTFTCMCGAILFGSATHLLPAQIGRFCIGLGASFAVIGTLKLIANWFPRNRFAFLTGLTITVGMLGAVGGQTPLALLVDKFDWRISMILLAIAGGILCVMIWFIVRDYPQSYRPTRKKIESPFTGLWGVLKSKPSWLLAIYGGLMFAPSSILGALWGVPFLTTSYGISRPVAASIISILFIGWAVGSPTSGYLSDYLNKRNLTLWTGTIGALITLSCFLYIHMPLALLSITLFAFGFFSSLFLPSFAIIHEINPPQSCATALGLMNMVNMFGGAFGQPLIGWILDKTWQGHLENGIRIYTTANFNLAFLMLPSCLIIALFMLFLIQRFLKKINIYDHDSSKTLH